MVAPHFEGTSTHAHSPACLAKGFSPGTDDHAGNAQKLELVPGYQPHPQVPVYTLHCQMETQAREVLHCGNFYQPVD